MVSKAYPQFRRRNSCTFIYQFSNTDDSTNNRGCGDDEPNDRESRIKRDRHKRSMRLAIGQQLLFTGHRAEVLTSFKNSHEIDKRLLLQIIGARKMKIMKLELKGQKESFVFCRRRSPKYRMIQTLTCCINYLHRISYQGVNSSLGLILCSKIFSN